MTHLRVIASLKERRDADETDLVVPHDHVCLVGLIGKAEGVLEDWYWLEQSW